MKRLLICAALIAWSGMASAVVYKWVDGQGKLQYGDNPPDGVHAEVVVLLGTHVARAASPPAETSKPAPMTPSAVTGTGDADTKKAVDADVAQTRDKQCTDAEARYKQLIEGRKLYKAGPDGERQYLTSEEIDAERLNAKNDVDSICISPR